MKEVHSNIIKIGVVILALFFILTGFYIYNIMMYSDRWINSAYNPRLNDLRKTTIAGGIYDTNNIELAGISAGKRSYPDDKNLRYATSHIIGDIYGFCSTGAETIYADILLNYDESIFEYINRYMIEDVRSGYDISLSIDSRLNIRATEIMGSYAGSIVILDYTTGDILCMISSPDFDPKAIDPKITHGGTTGDELVNRANQGQYVPGSIFKIITAGAAIENLGLWENLTFECNGVYETGGRKITCPTAHGELTLIDAFAVSCNSVFAQIGLELGASNIVEQAEKAGFNEDFIFDDIVLYNSSITIDSNSEPDAIAYASIGQHENVVSPLHMAMISASVANNGVMLSPRLLKSVDSKDIPYTKKIAATPFSATTAHTLSQMMRQAVTNGTAKKADIPGYSICGKTGTAEISTDDEMPPHSWFIGFIDETQHPLAIAVIVEHAGAGSQVATPYAKKILEYALEIGY